jgi:NAD dependent epimerase/dehydratase family enzyme
VADWAAADFAQAVVRGWGAEAAVVEAETGSVVEAETGSVVEAETGSVVEAETG